MNRNKTLLLGASALVAGAIVAGGVNLATAATGDGGTTGTYGYGFGGRGDGDGRGPGGARHDHTPVTGDERADVVAAVEAELPDVTVAEVVKDPDGSYDVIGTQDGTPVMVEVSEDLATVELRTGGPGGHGMRGGPGGPDGMHEHTAVTGAERTKVVDAVEAELPDVTVVEVRQDPDGSYDVMGTQDGAPVMVEVSEDLETIELRTGGPTGGHGGPPMGAPGEAPNGTDATPSTTT